MTNQEAVEVLLQLVQEIIKSEEAQRARISGVHPAFRTSARNFVHYLQLRSEEIRELQEFLHERGLSSLASSESHTLAQLLQVIRWLAPETDLTPFLQEKLCDFPEGNKLRRIHARKLLGSALRPDLPRIMVTFSSDMAADRMKIEELLKAGMTIARINCAHDDETVWLRMIQNLRKSVTKTGRPCKVYMDLAGPKIRTVRVPGRDEEGYELREGQRLRLVPGKKAEEKKEAKKVGRIGVAPAEILSMLRVGEHVYFDDGKFEAKVVEVGKKEAEVVITRISAKKPFLKAEKGVNLPDSDLEIPALTEDDRKNLPFVCQHADLVGYSFVSSSKDLMHLREELARMTAKPPAVVLKIERVAAVQNLPDLLLCGMQEEIFGVMIARGDLAVEIGFERLSEIQQEILWICESGHVPVIWATQVLENMTKTGFATRSEISDAAMGAMAECVMLNKGPYVVKSVETLTDILVRLTGHQSKKRYVLRPLSIAREFLNARPGE